MFSPDIYRARRARFAAMMGAGAVAIIPSGTNVPRNADNDYRFRVDSDFFYLTGFDEPGAVLLLEGGAGARSTLFVLPHDPKAELWAGQRAGPEKAAAISGVDNALPSDEFMRRFGNIVDGAHLYYPRERDPIGRLLSRAISFPGNPRAIKDSAPLVGELRVIKEVGEVTIMRDAAFRSARAHAEVMKLVRPGMRESDIEAELSYRFRKAGGHPDHAYPPIVASGPNACVLHHIKNDRVIKDDDLVLVDAGMELCGYASDITRTFPANGRFTKPERELYDVVLEAQHAATAKVRPGATLYSIHDVAMTTIIEGLRGLFTGNTNTPDMFTDEAYRRLFPHSIGHFLGLDVHDCTFEPKERSRARALTPGMVITVEPGVYIPKGTPGVPERYQGIGIRIEDDVLVTGDGHEILSVGCPTDPVAIERLMRYV